MINRSLEILSINKYTAFDNLFDNQPEGWIGSDVCHSIDLKIIGYFSCLEIQLLAKHTKMKDQKILK